MTDLQPCPGADLDDLDLTQVETYRRELDRRNPGSPLVRRSQQDLLLEVGDLYAEALNNGRESRRVYQGLLDNFPAFSGRAAVQARLNR